MAAWGMEGRSYKASTLKPHSNVCMHMYSIKILPHTRSHKCNTHLIFFSLPVGMHVESHRSEELCTVVQKLSFRRQTLKLYLIVVPHLIRGDGEEVMGRRGGGVYSDGAIPHHRQIALCIVAEF